MSDSQSEPVARSQLLQCPEHDGHFARDQRVLVERKPPPRQSLRG